MRTFAEKELQDGILREIRELYERRQELEASIRAVDNASRLRIEEGALVDIAAFRIILSAPSS